MSMRGRRGRLVPSAPQKACYEKRRRKIVHPKMPLPNKSAPAGNSREGPPVVGIEGWAVVSPPPVTVTVPTMPMASWGLQKYLYVPGVLNVYEKVCPDPPGSSPESHNPS